MWYQSIVVLAGAVGGLATWLTSSACCPSCRGTCSPLQRQAGRHAEVTSAALLPAANVPTTGAAGGGIAAAGQQRPGGGQVTPQAARARRCGGTELRQLTPPARLTQGCGAQRLCEVAVVDAAGEVGVGHVAGEQALQVGGNCKEGPGAVLSGAPARWPGAAQAAGSGGTARARAEPAWQARMRGSCGAAVPGRTGSTGCWGRGCRTPTGPGRARRWGCT